MGNDLSCSCRKPRPAKLIDGGGNLRPLRTPTTAAEVMVDKPGHVVCPAHEVRRTRRAMAMRADEELAPGEVYLLLPAARANFRASEAEIKLAGGGERGRRRLGGGGGGGGGAGRGRVFPAAEKSGEEERDEEEEKRGKVTGLAGERIGSYRQWRPVLETIEEGL